MIWFALSASAEPSVPGELHPTPITELEHPRYVDAAGAPVSWSEVRALSAESGALGQVRRRRLGRTVLRVVFAAATAVEVWGVNEIARRPRPPDSHVPWTVYPLAAQASLTGLCEVLLWTRAPQDRIEDRALVLDAANASRSR